ncbi:MAG: hypothetical protein ACR2RE_24990, partial [Geminicoccaceae bacterium]
MSDSEKAGFDIQYPYLIEGQRVNTKYRRFNSGDGPRFTQDSGGQKIVWNQDCLNDETLSGEPLVICEGEDDALIALQCGHKRVISV